MSFVAKNVRWFMRQRGLKEQAAAKVLGISQPSINRIVNAGSSRPLRDPTHATLEKIAKGMGVTVDALAHVDIEVGGLPATPQPQSQPAKLDIARLGIALTSIDKALADMEVQGKLGTLAEAIQFAYARAFTVRDTGDQAQRELFDELVAMHLRGWHGRTGTVETRTDEDREAQAPRAKAGRRR